MSDATIKIDGDLSSFRNQFTLANQFAERQLKEMADSAKKHTGAATAHASSSFNAMRGVAERSASIMGGAFGDLGDIVFDLGERATSAGGAIGGIGVTAGAAVVGVAALGYAAFQLAGYADEAAKRLEEAGLAALIPKESQESLDKYREGTKALRTEADLLTVSLSGDLLTAVGDLSFALTGALDKLGKLRDAAAEKVGADTGGVSMLRRVALGIGTLGASEVAGALSGAIQTQISDGEKLNDIRTTEAQLVKDGTAYMEREASAREAVNQEIIDGVDAERKLEEAKRARAAADRDAAKAAAEDAAAMRLMQAELAKLAAEDAADSARIRAQMLAGNDAAIAADASAAALAGQAGSIDFSGFASALGGGGGGIASAALKGLPGMLSGGGAGVLGSLGAAGPVGLAIGALVGLPSMIDGIAGTLDELTTMFSDLPDLLSTALGETLPGIIGDLPDLVTSIVDAVLQLPGVIATALPEIVSELTQLGPQLIADLIASLAEQLPSLFTQSIEYMLGGGLYGAIARGVWDGLNEVLDDFPQKIADKIGEALSKLLNPFKDKQGDVLGTNLTAEGGRRLFGIDLPSFDKGTSEITRTGLARVHRGEEIARKGEGGGRGGMGTVINVYGPDTREIVRQIRELLGGDHGAGYGLGDALP